MKRIVVLSIIVILLGAFGASSIIYGGGILLGIGLSITHVAALILGFIVGENNADRFIQRGVDIKTDTLTSETNLISGAMGAARDTARVMAKELAGKESGQPAPQIIDGKPVPSMDDFINNLTVEESKFLNSGE